MTTADEKKRIEEQAAALRQLYLDNGLDKGKASKRVAETLQKAGYKATAAQVAKWQKQYKGKSNEFYRGLLKDTRPVGSDSLRGLMGAKTSAKALAAAITAAERALEGAISKALGKSSSPPRN
jgi:hypothetical protein